MSETGASAWAELNHKALCAAFKVLHARLSCQDARLGNASEKEEMERKSESAGDEYLAISKACCPVPRIETLSEVFALSRFERDVLLVCAGMELDSNVRSFWTHAQGSVQSVWPTFGRLLSLAGAHWSAFAPDSPLRYWKLIELGTGGSSAAPLTTCPIRIDERVLHYLAGLSCLDERLFDVIRPVDRGEEVAPSHEAVVRDMVSAWSRSGREFRRPVVVLVTGDATAARAIAGRGCALSNLNLLEISTHALPTDHAELRAAIRLLERESRLTESAFLLELDDPSHDVGQGSPGRVVLERICSPLIVLSSEPHRIRPRPTVHLQVKRPNVSEEQKRWTRALARSGAELDAKLDFLVSHFGLNSRELDSAIDIACRNGEESLRFDDLLKACRIQARVGFEGLAQYVDAIATWDDLILPDAQKQTIRDIVAHVRWRTRVYETWGFSRKSSRGLGISAVFMGPSGTGKTMAAEVIAQALQLDLYRIDLSMVVSKYIGETEKNLRQVFQAGERSGAILLFDEADALFGKRSEVKDSHDRYANVEVAYLLQRFESYRGLSILTTNMKASIDPAFMRRIRFVVQFLFPEGAQRAAIWRRIFPSETPTAGLNIDKLAQLNVAGGTIRNIALNAAFSAAEANEHVTMAHILHAVHGEYAKLEKQLAPAEISGWF